MNHSNTSIITFHEEMYQSLMEDITVLENSSLTEEEKQEMIEWRRKRADHHCQIWTQLTEGQTEHLIKLGIEPRA